MCVASAPKVKQPKEKPVRYLANPYLDGINPSFQSLMIGTSSLRLDRGGARTALVGSDPNINNTVPAATTPWNMPNFHFGIFEPVAENIYTKMKTKGPAQ